MSSELIFQGTKFDVVDRNGQPWIKSRELARALGYKDESSIGRIFERNKDEFTDAMTATVKMTVGITPVDVRIFSLRGCHLLAMFSKTKVAKEFREWVLNVLDREARAAREQSAQQSSAESTEEPTITPEQQRRLRDIVDARVAELPAEHRRLGYKHAWGSMNRHFGIARYAQLPQSKFENAAQFLKDMRFPPFETREQPQPESQQDPEFESERRTIHISKEEMENWYREQAEKDRKAIKGIVTDAAETLEKLARRFRHIEYFSILLRG